MSTSIWVNKAITTPSKKKNSTISLIKLILFECIRRLLHQQHATNIHYNFNPSKQESQKHYNHVQREWTMLLQNSNWPRLVCTYRLERVGKNRCKIQIRSWLLGFKQWVAVLQNLCNSHSYVYSIICKQLATSF